MFFVGLLVGIVIGAVWMVGARIVVKMRRDNVVGTPSASHNRQSNIIMPHCKTCSGFDKVSLSRCYGCNGSKWAPA